MSNEISECSFIRDDELELMDFIPYHDSGVENPRAIHIIGRVTEIVGHLSDRDSWSAVWL